MSTGIVGDIHLRLDALRRTLAGPLAGCARLIAAGDWLDRGDDDPNEVLDALLEAKVELLVGNHELAYLGGPRPAGLVEASGLAMAGRLRELALDGKLQAAAVAKDVLVVHGGISRAYWDRELRDGCGRDPAAIARRLNLQLLHAVARKDFSAPAFAALADPVPGPFWAHLHEDLLCDELPPLRQAVGHVVVTEPGWHACPRAGGGEVFALDWHDSVRADLIGHLRIDQPHGAAIGV